MDAVTADRLRLRPPGLPIVFGGKGDRTRSNVASEAGPE